MSERSDPAEPHGGLYENLVRHVDRLCFGIAGTAVAVILAVAQISDDVDGATELQSALVASAVALPLGMLCGAGLPRNLGYPVHRGQVLVRSLLLLLIMAGIVSVGSLLMFLYPPSALVFISLIAIFVLVVAVS
jgi:hypothetical protein